MLFPRASQKPERVGPWAVVPEGLRVYAVGDIHGRADLLGKMAELIEQDLERRPARQPVTVCLGDYIDRGPGSAETIERLATRNFPTTLITLMGNHEEMFQQFMYGEVPLGHYLSNGGDATLRSYGISLQTLTGRKSSEIQHVLRGAIPVKHLGFLGSARLSLSVGDYFFCHAGARPGIPLDQQSEQDLLWIRDDFLRSSYDFGKIIVHGHTPVKTPDIRPNAINIDTRAFASGILTALVLEGTDRRFLFARM